jgi:hypothetical protein
MGLKQRSFVPKDSAEPHLSKGPLDKRLAAQLGVRRWERVREAGERVALAPLCTVALPVGCGIRPPRL